MHGETWPRHHLRASSPTSSFPVSGNQRRAPSPPPAWFFPRQVRHRRAAPSPPTRVPFEDSFPSPVRPKNLFNDFLPTLPRPSAATGGSPPAPLAPSPSEPPAPSAYSTSSPSYSSSSLSLMTASVGTSPAPSPPLRSPSPDVMLELYSHTRHPLDLRKHLTILPSWGVKGKKEQLGECVVCYSMNKHLQVQCKNCNTMKVCCTCIVGIYQSINSCPVCWFRGEY